jgi:diadenosine tetraphosphate (Ap4A) HIT family hydrolase
MREVSHRHDCDDSQLCLELAGETSGIAFHQLYRGHPSSRILLQSRNFALVADIAPLAIGHALLVPRRHFINFGQIPRALWSELAEFRERCVEWVANLLEYPVILEHGSASRMQGSSCISHAHWHVVPGCEGVLDRVRREFNHGHEIESWRNLRSISGRDIPYVYCSTARSEWICDASSGVRRHYVRMVLAEQLGLEAAESDWALTHHPERLRETVRLLRVSTIASC